MTDFDTKYTIKYFYNEIEALRSKSIQTVSFWVSDTITGVIGILMLCMGQGLFSMIGISFNPVYVHYVFITVLIALVAIISRKATRVVNHLRLYLIKNRCARLAHAKRSHVQEQVLSISDENKNKSLSLMITLELLEEILKDLDGIKINR